MPEPEGPEGIRPIVRPYARTGGRTKPAYELALEALVSTSGLVGTADALEQPEHRAIARICREGRSVAEVAALLSVPLGVARVLVGDMAAQGWVIVHATAGDATGEPDVGFLERVLDGLRRL